MIRFSLTTLTALITAALLFAGTAWAAVNAKRPTGAIYPLGGRWYWAISQDADVPGAYYNTTIFMKGLSYTATLVRPKGAAAFKLSKGVWQGFAQDHDSAGTALPGFYWFIQFEVK